MNNRRARRGNALADDNEGSNTAEIMLVSNEASDDDISSVSDSVEYESKSNTDDDPASDNENFNQAPVQAEDYDPMPELKEWNIPGPTRDLKFQGEQGPTEECFNALEGKENTPLNFYKLFLDEEVLNLLCVETNRYASQKIVESIANERGEHSRIAAWTEVSPDEMKIFMGMLLYMSVNVLPNMSDYWSRNKIYQNSINKKMSRNRFQGILANLHFADNNLDDTSRLRKLNPLLTLLRQKMQAMFKPGEEICIDESMIPFKGRLQLKQYIPGKRHKYGIKIYKLCSSGGYTYNFKVYEGRSDISSTSDVIKELVEGLLQSGRTLCMDNFFNSIELAEYLLENGTHCYGTLRKNRKQIPPEIKETNLQLGEMTILENTSQVRVAKWKSKKKDLLFITTKHGAVFKRIKKTRGKKKLKFKPEMVMNYNKSKAFIDVSDQLRSYTGIVRKGRKWYRKVGLDLLVNVCVQNALHLYKTITKRKTTISNFKKMIVEELLGLNNSNPIQIRPNQHKLERTEKRGRCNSCYSQVGREGNLNLVSYHCTGCEDKFMCMECFNVCHTITRRM